MAFSSTPHLRHSCFCFRCCHLRSFSHRSSLLLHAALPSSPPSFRLAWLIVRWALPTPGWCKLNFDGSVFHDGSRRVSIGGIIRGFDCGGASPSPRPRSTGRLGRAMIRGLRLALACFVERNVVEGDDLVLRRRRILLISFLP
uniref:RNase H type-1 domain-containing protein n=1 Tax=Oryza glumipatula TaxID=40148 RepID=A0A0D9ZXW9_9ORYZ